MKRLIRTFSLALLAIAATAVTSGCIVVPAGGGPYYHGEYHDHYWAR